MTPLEAISATIAALQFRGAAMAYREVSRMEIAEVIRRWQAGSGPQQIASGTGLSRNTVRKYLAAARAMGIAKDGPLARRGAAEPAGGHWPVGAATGGHTPEAGCAGALGRPDLPVAHRRPAADDPHPRVADLPGAVRSPTRRCGASWSSATGAGLAGPPSAWRTPRRARWPSPTSGVSA